MSTTKKIIGGIIVFVIVIQLIPVDRENPPVDAQLDFTQLVEVPEKAEDMLRAACYDCHSNETVYPNYAYVAPISWSIKDHVNEGRKYANFSEWGKYSKEAKTSIIKASIREIDEREMPFKGYDVYHPEAKWSKEDRTYIMDFFKSIQP